MQPKWCDPPLSNMRWRWPPMSSAARHACDAARSEHASAERLLEDKLMACEITRAQADAAIAKGEAWIASEQSRLDALREEVTKATATLTAIQESAKEHEAAGRPAHSPEEIAAALSDSEVRHTKASEEFIEARAVLINDDQSRSRMAEIQVSARRSTREGTSLGSTRRADRFGRWRQVSALRAVADPQSSDPTGQPAPRRPAPTIRAPARPRR